MILPEKATAPADSGTNKTNNNQNIMTNDETNQPSGSLLAEDLSSVDTSMPILKEGLYDMTISSCKEGTTKDKTGVIVTIILKTTAPAFSTTGEEVQPGFPVYHRMNQTPTGGMTADMIRKRNAQFVEAVEGKKTSLIPLDRFEGKTVRCKVGIQEETTSYPASNVIKNFVKP